MPRRLRRAWGSVGAGRRPRPLSGVDGACRRIVGADRCVGPWRVPCGGVPGRTHRSAPTRGGRYSEPTENWCEDRPCQRGGTEPAPYGCNRAGRSTAGCGHPALRVQHRWCAATGRCRHRPLRKGEQAASTSQASGAQRSVCGADGRNGWKLRQGSSTKGPSTADNPSVSLRLTAPFTQGSLWGRGMRIAASARWASSQ